MCAIFQHRQNSAMFNNTYSRCLPFHSSGGQKCQVKMSVGPLSWELWGEACVCLFQWVGPCLVLSLQFLYLSHITLFVFLYPPISAFSFREKLLYFQSTPRIQDKPLPSESLTLWDLRPFKVVPMIRR